MTERRQRTAVGSAQVNTQITQSGQVVREDQQEMPTQYDGVAVDMGDTTVTAGYTLSMGAGTYEFARVDVSSRIPNNPVLQPSDEQVQVAYNRAADFVDRFIREQANSVLPPERQM